MPVGTGGSPPLVRAWAALLWLEHLGRGSVDDPCALQAEAGGGVAPEDAPVLVRGARSGDEPLVGDDERGGSLDSLAERVVVRLEHPALRRGGGELVQHVTAGDVDAADEPGFAHRPSKRRLARGSLQARRLDGGERGERRERRIVGEPELGRRPGRLRLARRALRRAREGAPVARRDRARLGAERERLEAKRGERAWDVLERGADAPLGDETPGRERILVQDERDELGGHRAGWQGAQIIQ